MLLRIYNLDRFLLQLQQRKSFPDNVFDIMFLSSVTFLYNNESIKYWKPDWKLLRDC